MHKLKERLQEKLTYLNREIAQEQDYFKNYKGGNEHFHNKAIKRYQKLTTEKDKAENELKALESLTEKIASR